jgi:hypothetical protein
MTTLTAGVREEKRSSAQLCSCRDKQSVQHGSLQVPATQNLKFTVALQPRFGNFRLRAPNCPW